MATHNETERRMAQAYYREFGPAMLGYVIVLLAIIVLVDLDSSGGWKYPLALLPIIPAVWGVRAVARHLGRIDEMQRSLQVDGMAVGFGLAMITAMTVGFLAMAGLDTSRWGPWLIYSVGMLGWIGGLSRSASFRS